jgi:O-acetyl-ADP-ribose deacetylase (regulator of RNase III)
LAITEPLAVGSAIVTGAGDLPVDLLVHAIVTSATERVSREGVRRALRSALQRVLAWQIAEVAIPPFGLGAGNLDIDESAHLMADELARHCGTAPFPTRVTLVAETADEARALESAVARSVA